MADIPLSNVAGGSLIPRIPPAAGYIVPSSNEAYRCGFDNNGDSIELPATATGTIFYRDNAGNIVTDGAWAGGAVVADFVSAGATGFDGFTHFYMNDAGTLLYVIGYDTASSKIFTCTINKLGVISVLGSFTPSVIPNTSFRWQINAATGYGLVYDGTNFTFYTPATSGTTGKVVFNASTGALVSEESIGKDVSSWVYETPNGVGVGGFTANNTDRVLITVRTASKGQRKVFVDPDTGIFYSATPTDIHQWRGFITAQTSLGPKAVLKTDFDTFVDNVAKFVGIL